MRWRLLSGNNREIGRGAEEFDDPESCRMAIKDLQTTCDALVPAVRRDSGHAWMWQLSIGERLVAASAHGYDRLIRCERAMAQFRVELRAAPVGDVVMISQTRRWGGGYA